MPAARPILAVLVLSAPALAGCAGLSPAPEGFTYGRPDPDPAAYTFADTTELSIRTDLGPVEVVTAYAGVTELDFRRWSEDGTVTLRFPRLRGSFRSTMLEPSVVDESDLGGPITARLAPTGRVEIADTPSLTEALRDVTSPGELVRPLFVRLPGRRVEVGDQWVDTVTTTAARGAARTEARRVITFTLRGDTVAAGRRLVLIDTETLVTIRVAGESGGVALEQQLTGTTAGRVLWDDVARLLVERWTEGELTGTLTLPDLDVAPMPIEARVRSAVALRE
ncbi:MAG: hypothetical protein R3314_01765 [Longimicrobiales bacterium]|nr:hypothetical protein [Longimicrobiales bacterium]